MLFVLGLLGGGLVCLLVINTVLASGSYQINSLQQAEATRQQQVQALQQQVARGLRAVGDRTAGLSSWAWSSRP